MVIAFTEDDVSLAQVGLYASISFLVVSALGVLFYATCSRRYRLNWFENNLLEAATEAEDVRPSRDTLVIASVCKVHEEVEGSWSGGKGSASPCSIKSEDATFWVPPKTVQQQVSAAVDETPPPTPTSPTNSLKSNNLSVSSSRSVHIARSEKHVVRPANVNRTRVPTMNARLDHTKIDRSLYNNKSATSPQDSNDISGDLHVGILYDSVAGILSVRLIEAQNLQPRDFSGTADPYAKVRLLPERKNFWQTRIHKKTLNPVFDEDFVFEESPSVIEKRTIEILLYDFDAYSRHVCIGGAQIPLATLDLTEKIMLWTPLGSCAEQDVKVDLGEIMVSLAYLPSAERLTVVLVKARNLRIADDTRSSSDPYIKVALLAGAKKIKKRKTCVARNTVNPVYNEALTFNVSRDVLKSSLIEFTAVHDGLLGSGEILGRALVGSGAMVRDEEKVFFEEMFRAKNATAQWIPLQDIVADATSQLGTN